MGKGSWLYRLRRAIFSVSESWRNMLGGFSKHLKTSDNCVDGLLILHKSFIGHTLQGRVDLGNGIEHVNKVIDNFFFPPKIGTDLFFI